MKIEKSNLSEIKSIFLILENCEDFCIDAKDVVDIFVDNIKPCKTNENEFESNDGRLIISQKGMKNLSSFFAELEQNWCPDPETFSLKTRLLRYPNICYLEVKYKDGKKMMIHLPYNPLRCIIHGEEIELSNCPSAEVDKNGNMLILFGKSSHAPKRKDNNYRDLIDGFEKLEKTRVPKVLKVKVVRIQFYNDKKGESFSMTFVDKDKDNHEKTFKLVFESFTDICIDCSASILQTEIDLNISRLNDGKIAVQLGKVINFYCKGIKLTTEKK
jgi:hypothetical protein